MVAILDKTEHNTDFHQIVDFLQGSHIRYALTVCPTVYVSHIRQFWSTARIETADGETHILANINGRQRTISESSIRRHLTLKLMNEEGLDMENILKTSAMPHESSPRVTSLGGEEGNMKQQLKELMDFCTNLQSQHTTMAEKIKGQDLEISSAYRPKRGGIDQGESDVNKVMLKKIVTNSPCYFQMISTALPLTSEPVPPAEAIYHSARNNEMINKHMAECEEAENELSIEEKTELITELINYQKDFDRIKKYQAQQQRLALKSERRKFYTSVLKSHAGWKTKDFRERLLKQIEEKFNASCGKDSKSCAMDSKKESEKTQSLESY
ncbi:hypothetical protein Tco_1194222 [Tanacetum coccineum]